MDTFTGNILCPKSYNRKDRLATLQENEATLKEVLEFYEQFFLGCSTELLFFGNLDVEKSEIVTNQVISKRQKLLDHMITKFKIELKHPLPHLQGKTYIQLDRV